MSDRLSPSQSWTGIRVGVLGLGRSGRGAVRLLRRASAAVVAFDDRSASLLDAAVIEELRALDVAVHAASGDVDSAVRTLDELVVSPGVRADHPLVLAAERVGVPVIGELELACRRTAAQVVAVTGTNGKSTTVTMVHAMLQNAGRNSLLAGNIGTALSDEVEKASADGWLVVEASSFQLERIEHFHPRAAAILNVAPDHLDRYPDFEGYANAKRNLLRNLDAEDTFVFPVDDPRLHDWARQSVARHGGFATAPHPDALAWIENANFVRRTDRGSESVLALDAFSLVGAHNRLNALAAIALGTACGLEAAPMAATLRDFTPLAHRAVLIPTHDGITWIDDSKATNVHAASATLGGLEAPVVALLGGRGKGEDYTPLRDFAAGMRVALCYGEEGRAIAAVLDGATQVELLGGMDDAMERAIELAQPGDVVLLSPACASFDEFRSFEHRGDVFAAWVRARRGEGR